jgi:hypothetical protein
VPVNEELVQSLKGGRVHGDIIARQMGCLEENIFLRLVGI